MNGTTLNAQLGGDMKIVSGLTCHQLRTHLAAGTITAITRGFHVWGTPTPVELLHELQRRHPGLVATGTSAAHLYLGQELEFPLSVAYGQKLGPSAFYTVKRRSQRTHVVVGDLRVHHPLLAFDTDTPRDLALAALEHHYAHARGRRLLERHRSGFERLPRHTHGLLTQAALFTDSGAEAKVARALKTRGMRVDTNFFIGDYLWDIVLPDMQVAVEINGFEFHSKPDAVVRDHWKNNDAVLRGWTTLRYTGTCVAHHLGDVVEQIATAKSPNLAGRLHRMVTRWHHYFTRQYDDPWGARIGPTG